MKKQLRCTQPARHQPLSPRRERKDGLFIVEFMVVIAVVFFLTMMALPSFKNLIGKAKRTEAYMNLHAIYAAEKAYFAEHGKYTTNLGGPGGAGFRPEGYRGGGANEKFYYTYGFGGSEGVNYFTGKLGAPASLLGRTNASNNTFVAGAAGDIDGDGEPDLLTIDQDSHITIIKDDI